MRIKPLIRLICIGLFATFLATFVALGAGSAWAVGVDGGKSGASVIAADVSVEVDGPRTRFKIALSKAVTAQASLMEKPDRLIIDLPEVTFHLPPEAGQQKAGLIASYRYGLFAPGRSRVVMELTHPATVSGMTVEPNKVAGTALLTIELTRTEREAFHREALANAAKAAQSPAIDPAVEAKEDSRPVIVIDPGHGGIDSGAEGVSGTLEKTITLAFALELKKKLEQDGRFAVHLTRDRDIFLRLDERVRIARQHGADLFLSLHADTIRYKSIRGATVYTVSDQASDAEAAAVAARENLSDELAGMAIEDGNHEVTDILMDLVRRETHTFSMRFANVLVGELSDDIALIKNPHRYAGFRVLKAPDVPSVLLELGYLSNPEDEAQLRDVEWRAKAIEDIAAAVKHFAGARVGSGN